jgi:hypothetical protein
VLLVSHRNFKKKSELAGNNNPFNIFCSRRALASAIITLAVITMPVAIALAAAGP